MNYCSFIFTSASFRRFSYQLNEGYKRVHDISSEQNACFVPQVLCRHISRSSALCRKNLAAAGPEKFTAEFIQKQIEDFNIGKRHLANIMGEDPENFTQEDIDVSKALTMCKLLYLIVFFLCPSYFFNAVDT